MLTLQLILTALIILLIVGVVYVWLDKGVPVSDGIVLVERSHDIRNGGQIVKTVPLPRSHNQPQGMTYSYMGWLLVKDYTPFGQTKMVFDKGESPSVKFSSTQNDMLVTIDTFGTKEVVVINELPAKKWIHFAIVVNQYATEIYINGTLRQHHTLNQLPKQNDEPVKIGEGWDGVLARLRYFPRSLEAEEVRIDSTQENPDDLTRKASSPNYFDLTWYTGRVYSSST